MQAQSFEVGSWVCTADVVEGVRVKDSRGSFSGVRPPRPTNVILP